MPHRSWRAALFAAIVAFAATGAFAEPKQSLTPVPGRRAAPDLVLSAVEGNDVRLASLRGKVVVVNFWATWCPPCRLEMPSLEKLNRSMEGAGLAVIGVNAGEDLEAVMRFRTQVDPAPTFPLFLDPDGKALQAFGVKGLPATFVLDRDGRIAYRALGARRFDDPAIVATLRALARRR